MINISMVIQTIAKLSKYFKKLGRYLFFNIQKDFKVTTSILKNIQQLRHTVQDSHVMAKNNIKEEHAIPVDKVLKVEIYELLHTADCAKVPYPHS